MNNSPLVSFCMSTYKRPDILRAQLKKILLQQYENFEIIISDNDTDASAKNIAEEIGDTRIKYFTNAENLGMVKSFNKSIARSSGEYIVMITDDDPVYPEMLKTLIELKNSYPGYGVYAGCGDLIVENTYAADTVKRSEGVNSLLLKTIPENSFIKMNKDEIAGAYLDGLFSTTYLLWSCAIIKREIVIEIKGMPDYGSELLTDHAYIIAACSFEGLFFINKALGGQVVHGENFGYNFLKLKEKYINTPVLFYNYLRNILYNNPNWGSIEKKIWNFAGRGWVEYSMMLFYIVRKDKRLKAEFFKAFRLAFSNKNIHKWKYKFYLKVYFKKLFFFLLKIKQLISNK